jgi:hypothetical protein
MDALVKLEIEILANLKAEWERHAETCDQFPKAFLLNPGNHELLGWDEALGVPVLPDQRVEPKRCRLLCGVGRGGSCAEGEVFWDAEGRSYIFEAAGGQD